MSQTSSELPHDFLAEKAFIGSLLVDNRAYDEVTDIQMHPDDFYHPQYSSIYNSIRELSIADQPFDIISVCA